MTRFVVGTGGWSFPHWRGMFYPPGVPQKEWLAFYASRLASVELQNTMYRLPKEHVVEAWRDAVPSTFAFALKASRRITHEQRLENCAERVALFADRIAPLREKLGAVLYQLAPAFARDEGRLRTFLATLPRDQRAVFEFRHTSWFDDAIYALLREYDAALALSDLAECPTPHDIVTAPFTYARLYGPGGDWKKNYDERALRAWADRFRALAPAPEIAYIYLNNDQADAPANAARLATLLSG